MSTRIESWLQIQQGARTGTDGHLQAGPNAGAYVAIELDEGEYKSFDDVCEEVKDQLNAASAANAWGITFSQANGADWVTFSGTAAFKLKWYDDELQEYLGFANDEYLNYTVLTTDTMAIGGRITLDNPANVEWFDLLDITHAQDQHGRRGGLCFTVQHGQRMTFQMVKNSEIPSMAKIVMRLSAGFPARVWLDHSDSGTFDWTAADWKKGRDLALYDPSGNVNAAAWVALTHDVYRDIELEFVEVS